MSRASPPRLVPWSREPADVAVFLVLDWPGERRRAFGRRWLNRGGNLDLRAVPLAQGKNDGACALWVGRVADPGLVRELLGRQDIPVYYRELTEEEADREPDPTGRYLPWYMIDANPPGQVRDICLVSCDGCITLQPQHLGPFFTLDGEPEFEVVSEDYGPVLNGVLASAASEQAGGYVLPCGPRPVGGPRIPMPEAQCERLEAEVLRLREMIDEHYRFREEQLAPQWLNVYRETGAAEDKPGSAWALRYWFCRTTREALDQYEHARVCFEGLGTLHFVRARVDPRDLTAAPPPGRWALLRDTRWQAWDQALHFYLPESVEFWPPPSRANPHLTELLRDRLWGPGPDRPSLALLRERDEETGEATDHLLAVPRFAPLRQQMEALNIDVSMERVAGKTTYPDVLGKVRERIESSLRDHVKELETTLQAIWAEMQHLKEFDGQVQQCAKLLAGIHGLHDQISRFERGQWQGWSEFRQAVLERDREMVPDQQVREVLEQIDALRNRALELSGTSEGRRRLRRWRRRNRRKGS
jgi:hypothetical protein